MPLFRWNIRLPILTSVVAHIAVASTTYYISTLDEYDPARLEKQIDMVFLPPPIPEVEPTPEPVPDPLPPTPPAEPIAVAPVPIELPPNEPTPDAVAIPIPISEPPKIPEPEPEPIPKPAAVKPPPEPKPKPKAKPLSPPPQPKPKPPPPAIVDPPPAPRPNLQKLLKSLIAYPWSAKTNCEQRIALVQVTVDADGWISAYKVIRSTGYGPVDAAIGDEIRRAPRLPLPAGTKLPDKSDVIVPVAVTLPDCSDRFAAVEEEGNQGFSDDPGPGDGEVDPMGVGSASLTDQESGLGFTEDHGPSDGEVDPTGPGSEDLTDQESGDRNDPFIQPLECTMFGINCAPDETEIR